MNIDDENDFLNNNDNNKDNDNDNNNNDIYNNKDNNNDNNNNNNNNNNNDRNDNIINSLLNMLKDEKKEQNPINKISESIREKKQEFLNPDIWKQNERKNEIFNDRKMLNFNNIDNDLNEDFQNCSKLFSQEKKLNSLEDVKKKLNNNEQLKFNFQDKSNSNNDNSKKKEEENNVNQPNIVIADFGKNFYLPDIKELERKKHIFESYLNIDNNNKTDNSKGIPQLVTNNNIELLLQRENKTNLIEKTFENKFDKSLEKKDDDFDEMLINKIISNMKKINNEDEEYSITFESPFIPKNLKQANIQTGNHDFIINDLLIFSKNYMEKILELITKTNINFRKISFCFIIDCSKYFGIKDKLFNLMIILSIIKICYIIDIEFSILLSADDKYKVVIKNYEETINYENLIEILYETIIIKRFRNNILKAIKTAIQISKNNKRNTIFFGFFDYMDESFTYPKYWLKHILNEKKNSFLLILERSRLYKKENEEIISNMIKNFEEQIKDTVSKLKILDINENDIEVLFSKIMTFLNDIYELTTPIEDMSLLNDDNNNKEIEIFKERQNLNMKKMEDFEKIIKDEFYKKYHKIYFKNNIREKSKINLSESLSKNENLGDIDIPKYEQKDFPENQFFKTLFLNSYQDKTLIESIFYPNKATQKILSTKGTEIDIMALILYTLQPVQEPMIYLEDKGGLIRNYSISIIIDNSKSCFSEFNESHSFLTMVNLFHIINSMTIPSLDIILTSNEGEKPDILLFDKPSTTIFKNYAIFEKLLILLSNPLLNSDLSEAIKVVYKLKKKKKNNRDSYLFILTDGLSFRNTERKINDFSKLCQNIGIKIYVIGLGIYPYRAQISFDTFIYSVNPEFLLKAISKIFGKVIQTESELELVSDCQNEGNLDDIFKKIEANDKYFFEELRKELNDIEKGDDVSSIFRNEEKNTSDELVFIEKGENLEIYSKNILKTQKILMAMFWSYDLNQKGESPYVSPEYINIPCKENGGVCIRSAIEHFGVENVIVLDYESAINELLKKNEKGECNYYAVWVFCGPQLAVFPPKNGLKNTSNPNLVGEFINILIEFWNNGGALVFLADGDPLNFQVNLFLEKIDFSKDEKPDFRIHGDYIGNNYLIQDKTGKIKEKGKFNKSNHKINYKGKEIQRQSLSHNLGQIYEGYTISFAVDKQNNKIPFNECKKLSPFKPFAINSEGGISTLIYDADSQGRGDILIDCGYTKCFLNMYKSGTYKFIQNIAGWTARPEIKFLAENLNPWDWRPKGINYKVNYNAKYDGFLKLENGVADLSTMRTLFCIDDSGSTSFSKLYNNELKDIISKHYNKNRGDIFYLWNSDKKKISYEEFELKINKWHGSGGTYPYLIADIIEEEK